MVRTAELGLDLAAGPGRLPLDEATVRQASGGSSASVAAVRALTLQEPTRMVSPRSSTRARPPRRRRVRARSRRWFRTPRRTSEKILEQLHSLEHRSMFRGCETNNGSMNGRHQAAAS